MGDLIRTIIRTVIRTVISTVTGLYSVKILRIGNLSQISFKLKIFFL